MTASKSVFMPLLYVRNHPKYQELMLRDSCYREMMPETIKKYCEKNESFTKSDNRLAGQGVDFLQEEVRDRP